jgi:hypothetical protein
MNMAKSLKDKKKNHHIVYIYIYIYVLACILALITNLLKLWELGKYFKNTQKIFCFFSFSIWIMNLYIKHIPDIKKEVPFLLLTLEQLVFYPIRYGPPYWEGLFLNLR